MSVSPPIAPGRGGPLYFVLCDYGSEIGRAYHEADSDRADRETVLSFLIRGEYTGPVQVLEVDLSAGRCRDASAEFAEEIMERTQLDDLPADVAEFVCLRAAALSASVI
jgi:hypothetical protein